MHATPIQMREPAQTKLRRLLLQSAQSLLAQTVLIGAGMNMPQDQQRNAARCGRTHCYLTGSFFLAMAAATVGHGIGVISVGGQGWLWIGTAIAVGTVVLWIVPERLFGSFLTHNRSS